MIHYLPATGNVATERGGAVFSSVKIDGEPIKEFNFRHWNDIRINNIEVIRLLSEFKIKK